MLESIQGNTLEYQRLSQEEMERRGILGRLVGVCADIISPTRNGRKYPEELWEKVFESPLMKERIENGVCYGELGHPADREETDIEKIAVCLAEPPKKGKDGKLRAVFDILSTPNGKILKSLCDYGSTLGISSRGSGDLVTDFDGNESVDPNTYNCEGFDIVLLPAVKEARLQYVTESLDKTRYRKTLRSKLQESLDKASESDRKIMEESLFNLGIQLNESILKHATPYMLRNDGECIECAPMHPYLKSYFEGSCEKNLQILFSDYEYSLDWYYNNTNQQEIRNYLKSFVKSVIECPDTNKYKNIIDTCVSFDYETNKFTDDFKELCQIYTFLNNLVNQEFCRIRTSDMLFGGNSGDLYCRISSTGFNWFDIIYKLVAENKDFITSVTICKDGASFGGSNSIYSHKGEGFDHMPTDEFLTLSGNPIIEKLNGKCELDNHAIDVLSKGGNLSEAYDGMHPRNAMAYFSSLQEDYVNKYFLNRRLWDSSRVQDLVNYYLEKENLPIDELIDKVRTQMEDEGSKLPSSDKEFEHAVYDAIDDFEDNLNESISTLGIRIDESDEIKVINYKGDVDFPLIEGRFVRSSKYVTPNNNYVIVEQKFENAEDINDEQVRNFKFYLDPVAFICDITIQKNNGLDRERNFKTFKNISFRVDPYRYFDEFKREVRRFLDEKNFASNFSLQGAPEVKSIEYKVCKEEFFGESLPRAKGNNISTDIISESVNVVTELEIPDIDSVDNLTVTINGVMGAYQNANKWLDSVKEFLYTDLSCPFFSSFVHELAHSMPGRFDKFGDILHTANITIPYPTTMELDRPLESIDDAFDVIFGCLDSIKENLNAFIKETDESNHGMACSAETLLNEIESEYSMLFRLKTKWEQCEGNTVEFDKYVMQYVEHKDDLLESIELNEKSFAGSYRYNYGVHRLNNNGQDILLGGAKTPNEALEIAIEQVDNLIENPWMNKDEKITSLRNIYIADEDNETEMFTPDLEDYIDNAIFNMEDIANESIEIEEKDGKFFIGDMPFNSEKNAKAWIKMNELNENSKNKQVQQLNKNLKDDIEKELMSLGLEDDDVERGMNGKLSDLEDTINIDKYLNEEQVGRDSLKDAKKPSDVLAPQPIIDPTDAVVDDEAMDIYESLSKIHELENTIINLQEKLSVGYAKEAQLKEDLENYRNNLVKLSAANKKCTQLSEKLSNSTKQEARLAESLNQHKGLVEKLERKIEFKDSKIKQLTEKLTEVIADKNKEVNTNKQLTENYSETQKDLSQLKEQYSKKLDQQNQLIEKYQKIARKAIDKYIDNEAMRLGVKSVEIKNRLPENYSFNDIDRICENLREYKLNVSTLPFNTNSVLNENISLKVKNIDRSLSPANKADELTDYDLRLMEAFAK